MNSLSAIERDAIAQPDQGAMLARVLDWAAVNSGSRNLDGLAQMGSLLADAFASLPGEVTLVEPAPVTAVRTDGSHEQIAHGRHLVVRVRPQARLRLLFTGHMDTVFPADHTFQACRWLDEGTLNGPGVADMKGNCY